MSEQSPSAIGTVAQEAARLIEDMATMARASRSSGDDPSPYAGEGSAAPVGPEAPHAAGPSERDQAGGSETTDEASEGTCSMCGAEHSDTPGDSTPSSCRICPLCRGIALLRSVRPETVDLLADFAMSVAGSVGDGVLVHGAFGVAAEIGHMRVVPGGFRCGCGNRGCWEMYASGTALVREAQDLVSSGSPLAARLGELCGGDPAALRGPDVTS